MVGMNQPMYREDHDMGSDEFEAEQNGNVSRLLNQVQKELAIMNEELSSLAQRLAVVTRPTEPMAESGESDGPGLKPPTLSPLAQGVSDTLGAVRKLSTRVREIKLGVDL